MSMERDKVEIFGRCFRLLNKIALEAGDSFFSRLCFKESDKLLSEFVFFLRKREEESIMRVTQTDALPPHQKAPSVKTGMNGGETRSESIKATGVNPWCGGLQHKNAAKRSLIAQHPFYVAQSGIGLILRIKNVLNLLEILKHLGLAKLPASLLLERDLLLLELSVLNSSRPETSSLAKAGKPTALRFLKTGPKVNSRPFPKPGRTHEEILEFIKTKERVQNLEVFSRFNHIGRRTLKKKLSDLAKMGSIKRAADGKRVFYSSSGLLSGGLPSGDKGEHGGESGKNAK